MVPMDGAIPQVRDIRVSPCRPSQPTPCLCWGVILDPFIPCFVIWSTREAGLVVEGEPSTLSHPHCLLALSGRPLQVTSPSHTVCQGHLHSSRVGSQC